MQFQDKPQNGKKNLREPWSTSSDSLNRNGDLMPKSPGITKNQNLKDRVLQEVYNRKIKELISKKCLKAARNSHHIPFQRLKTPSQTPMFVVKSNPTLSPRRARACAEENIHQVGQLPPGQDQLQDHGSLHGSQGRQNAHQITGDSFRRATGELIQPPPLRPLS